MLDPEEGNRVKQLKGNLIKIAQSLQAIFDVENAKDATREHTQPKEILMVRVKRERQDEQGDLISIATTTQGFTFSARYPWPKGWKGDNPLIIQASI